MQSHPRYKPRRLLIVFAAMVWASLVVAEEDPRFGSGDGETRTKRLKTRRYLRIKKSQSTKRRYFKKESKRDSASGKHPTFSVLLHTPLFKENTFDKRFQAYGPDFLASLPIGKLGDGSLDLEFGLGFTLARVAVPPVIPDAFTHLYFQLPIRLRWINPIDSKLHFEIIAGLQSRIFEYDGRPGNSSGFFFVEDFWGNLDPNLGVGLLYKLNENLKLRLVVEYLHLSAGIEF